MFTKSLSYEYRLSLKLGINGISYLIVDGLGKALIYKKYEMAEKEDILKAVKSFFTGDDKLLHNYKIIKIAVDSQSFTLVPQRLFKEEDSHLYLQKTSPQNQELSYYSNDAILSNEAHLVYASNEEFIHLLKNYFPSGKIYHTTTALIYGWQKQAQEKEGKKIYIHIEAHYFTIALFEETHLIFINRFYFQTSGDFIYFTLMILDRFELQAETIPVIISGSIEKKSEIYKKLYRYIRNVSFIPNLGYYDFPNSFAALQHYYNFDLYSLKLCE